MKTGQYVTVAHSRFANAHRASEGGREGGEKGYCRLHHSRYRCLSLEGGTIKRRSFLVPSPYMFYLERMHIMYTVNTFPGLGYILKVQMIAVPACVEPCNAGFVIREGSNLNACRKLEPLSVPLRNLSSKSVWIEDMEKVS